MGADLSRNIHIGFPFKYHHAVRASELKHGKHFALGQSLAYDFVGNFKSVREAQQAGRRYAEDLVHNSMAGGRLSLAFPVACSVATYPARRLSP